MTYSKTIICERSGMTLTLIDDFPDGDYSTFKSHPQLGNLHQRIEKHKSRCPKSAIAGGILNTLLECNRFAYCSHYPKTIMGMLNAELCLHDAEFLYSLYQKVQTFCYGKSIIREAQFNLMSTGSGRWGIVNAIRSLLRDDESIPENSFVYATQQASALMRRKARVTLTANGNTVVEKLGNMNLDKVIDRVQKLSRKCSKLLPKQTASIESNSGITIDVANNILPSYVFATEEKRLQMAVLYSWLLTEFKETIHTPTQKRSFEKVAELLKDTKIAPISISNGGELDLSDLEI